MGFLKNIFKKKSGGTFLGNILRGASSKVSGGILGSGAGLQRWEQEQAQQAQQAYDAEQARIQMMNTQAYNLGTGFGNSANNTPVVTGFRNGQAQEWLTRNYSLVVVGVIALIGLTVYFVKRKK